MTRKPHPPRHAFTLLEILVVIAIIVLLSAILFPVFSRVREKARQSSCASNMRQLGLGFMQYREDNDGRYPHAWDSDPTKINTTTCNAPKNCLHMAPTNDPVVWPAKLEPYVKSRQVFNCPSAYKLRSSPCDPVHPTYTKENHRWLDGDPVVGTAFAEWVRGASQVPYGYNVQYIGGGQFLSRLSCHNTRAPSASNCYNCGIAALDSQIARPAETVLLIENNWQNSGVTSAPAFANIVVKFDPHGDFWCKADGTTDTFDSFDARHNGGLNVTFADGHVKWMRKEVAAYRPVSGDMPCSTLANYGHDAAYLWDRM